MNSSYFNPAFGVGTGGQPQQPVFGAGEVQMPIDPSKNDIMIAQGKKSRKGIIIVILLVLVFIGGFFAVLFSVSQNSGKNVGENTKLAFNRYANYLLYGEDSDMDLNKERIDNTEDYVANNLITNDDTGDNENGVLARDYFSKAEQLWDAFYDGLGDKELANFGGMLDEYKEDFEFTRIFVTNGALDNEQFVAKFMTMDNADIVKWIRKHFAAFVNSNYESIQKYGENGIRYYSLYAEYLEQVKTVGCLSDNGGFVMPCDGLNTLAVSDEMIEIGNQMKVFQDKAIMATFDDCWKIEKILDGENEQVKSTNNDEGGEK